MRRALPFLLAASFTWASPLAAAQGSKPSQPAIAKPSADSNRRQAPPLGELVDVFAEIEPFTNQDVFVSYDRNNKVKLKTATVFTLKSPGKASTAEARMRSPRVMGERVRNGVLPAAVWTSTVKTQRVDFLVGGSGTHAIWAAEEYESPAVFAGGDPHGLEQVAQLVNGFRLPVTVRIVYQDGQV